MKNTTNVKNENFDFVFKDYKNNFKFSKTKEGGCHQNTAKIINTPIYKGTVIAGKSTVQNCTINDQVTIQDNAIVRESTLNDYSKVGGNAVVERCILFDNSFIHDNAIVKDGVWMHGTIDIGGNVKIKGKIQLSGKIKIKGDITINEKLLREWGIKRKGGFYILNCKDYTIENKKDLYSFLKLCKNKKEEE